MIIHPQKTKTMLIGNQRKLAITTEDLNIYLKESSIKQSDCEKLVGVYLDPLITWKDHVHKTIKKFNTKLELVRRAKPFLNSTNRKQLYNSIVKLITDYCSSVWENCSSECLEQLLLAQKQGARLILDTDRNSRSLNLFQELKMIPVSDAIHHRILTLTYKCRNAAALICLSNQLVSPVYHYRTRTITQANLSLPKIRTNAGKRRFSYITHSLWSSLSSKQKPCDSLSSFKHQSVKYFKTKLCINDRLEITRLY